MHRLHRCRDETVSKRDMDGETTDSEAEPEHLACGKRSLAKPRPAVLNGSPTEASPAIQPRSRDSKKWLLLLLLLLLLLPLPPPGLGLGLGLQLPLLLPLLLLMLLLLLLLLLVLLLPLPLPLPLRLLLLLLLLPVLLLLLLLLPLRMLPFLLQCDAAALHLPLYTQANACRRGLVKRALKWEKNGDYVYDPVIARETLATWSELETQQHHGRTEQLLS